LSFDHSYVNDNNIIYQGEKKSLKIKNRLDVVIGTVLAFSTVNSEFGSRPGKAKDNI
jgi:hypothetical protein